MKLTTKIVKRYEGGQLEIQNQNENYLFRGEIGKAWVKDNSLHVKFNWLAKMSNKDGKWYADQKLDYSIDLELASVSDFGKGIFYSVMYIWENGTFFPPDGSKLDPNKVIGLQTVD